MDYPYINLDLLKEYAVFFHGDIGKKSLQCYMCWDGDCYFIKEAVGGFLEMFCTFVTYSPYPVITIEELIEMSNPPGGYDFSNELQTLLDN